MKVQTKSLSQRGACLAVASLFCGLFYNSLSSYFMKLLSIGFNVVVFLLGLLFFVILPSFFWISLAVLLVLSFMEDQSNQGSEA